MFCQSSIDSNVCRWCQHFLGVQCAEVRPPTYQTGSGRYLPPWATVLVHRYAL